MQILNQDIKDGSFKKAYLLFGEEAFLKMSYKNRLKDAVTAGDTMNFNHYEGKGMDINEIIGIAAFFCRAQAGANRGQRLV